MNREELQRFAEQLAALDLTEPDKVIAVLWFHDHHSPGFEASLSHLADAVESLALTGRMNRPRLRTNIAGHPALIRGGGDDRYRIHLSAKPKLNEAYLPLLKRRNPVITDDVLPDSQVKGTRPYLEAMGRQINGCFNYGFYDGCATLCRRMVESLLIDVFMKTGHLDKISNGKNLMMLADIIAVAKSGHHFRLARGTDASLDLIKEIGDRAAHHRTHVTTRQDIEQMSVKFRAVVSELMNLAGITPGVPR